MLGNLLRIRKLQKMNVIERNQDNNWVLTEEFQSLISATAWRYEDTLELLGECEEYDEMIVLILANALKSQAAMKKMRIRTFREWTKMTDILTVWYPLDKFREEMEVD